MYFINLTCYFTTKTLSPLCAIKAKIWENPKTNTSINCVFIENFKTFNHSYILNVVFNKMCWISGLKLEMHELYFLTLDCE